MSRNQNQVAMKLAGDYLWTLTSTNLPRKKYPRPHQHRKTVENISRRESTKKIFCMKIVPHIQQIIIILSIPMRNTVQKNATKEI